MTFPLGGDMTETPQISVLKTLTVPPRDVSMSFQYKNHR